MLGLSNSWVTFSSRMSTGEGEMAQKASKMCHFVPQIGQSLTNSDVALWLCRLTRLFLDHQQIRVIRREKPQAQFVAGRRLDVERHISIRDGIVGGDHRPAAIDPPNIDCELLRRQVLRDVSSHHIIRDHESIAVRLEREEHEDIAVVKVRVIAGCRRPRN